VELVLERNDLQQAFATSPVYRLKNGRVEEIKIAQEQVGKSGIILFLFSFF